MSTAAAPTPPAPAVPDFRVLNPVHEIVGQPGTETEVDGRELSVTAGTSSSGLGGALRLSGGLSETQTGGSLFLLSGASTSGAAGDVILRTGDSAADCEDGGHVSLSGRNITMTAGAGSGTICMNGTVEFQSWRPMHWSHRWEEDSNLNVQAVAEANNSSGLTSLVLTTGETFSSNRRLTLPNNFEYGTHFHLDAHNTRQTY